jgi:hypothetical protein
MIHKDTLRTWILKTIETTKDEVELLSHFTLLETMKSKWQTIYDFTDEEYKEDIRILASFYDD